MRRLAAIILGVGLGACAATGVQVSDKQAAAFQPGKAVYADVVKALGEPTSQTHFSDGSRVAVYTYAQMQTRPATFIPIVGLFAGGADTSARTVMFRFAPDGKLIDHTSSTSTYGTSMVGPAGGAPPGAADQPQQ